MPLGEPTRETMSTLRNSRGESNARNPAQTCEITDTAVHNFPCGSLRSSPHNVTPITLATRSARIWLPTGPSSSSRTAGAPLAPLPSRAATTAPPPHHRFPSVLPSVYLMPNQTFSIEAARPRSVVHVMLARAARRCEILCALGNARNVAVLEANARNLAAGANARNFRAVQIHTTHPWLSHASLPLELLPTYCTLTAPLDSNR